VAKKLVLKKHPNLKIIKEYASLKFGSMESRDKAKKVLDCFKVQHKVM